MALETSNAYTVLTELTLKKGSATATLNLRRLKDGSVEFTDEVGNKVKVDGPDKVTRLFNALDALT